MKRYLMFALLPALMFGNGPDRGGYRWIDSDEAGGPAFEWIDIRSTGTRIPLVDDDNQGPFAIGFSCDFYGQPFDSIRVCSDGWLSFTSESHQFHHYPIPDVRDPNNLLAPMWADLNPAQGGSVYYLEDTANGRFVMSWIDVPFYYNTDSVTFQVVLDTAGNILFQYLRIPPSLRLGADSCTVGIEDAAGDNGLQYYCDGSPSENQLHDSLAVRFYRLHLDACPTALLRPVQQVLVGDSIIPLAVIRNTGLDTVTFPATLRIGGSYLETLTVAGLAPLTDRTLQFPTWVPGADTYALELGTALGGDEFPANDTLRTEIVAAYAGELGYDDGEADAWFMKNGSPTNEWAGAVRFSVPYGDFQLSGARVFVDDTTRFSRVIVCPDSSDVPQVSRPYLLAESVGASQPESWIDIAADTLVTTDVDLWLAAFWQSRATGPQMGEDREAPVDRRTYFGSPTVRWFAYNSGDVMVRLLIDGQLGVSEVTPTALARLEVTPNPFRRTVTIVSRGGSSQTLKIRDIAGRCVRELRPMGLALLSAEEDRACTQTQAVWDGRDQNGRRLPAGAYFIEARIDTGRQVVQVLLAR